MRTRVKTIEEAKERLNSLNGDKVLSAQTEIKSVYENAFKGCLLEFGIGSSYEPFSFVVGHYLDKTITYTPDFLTELTVKNRRVILEPHPMRYMDRERMYMDLTKFNLFKKNYREAFYLIVASDLDKPVMDSKAGIRVSLSDSLDEYWTISRVNATSGDDYSTKRDISSHLKNLVKRLRK